MGKPIWELEPDVIDAELARARRDHENRAERPVKPSTTTPPPLPVEFAAGTNRSRGAGLAKPPPIPAVAGRPAVEPPPRVIEIEAAYDEEFGEFEEVGGRTEFEGVQATAEMEAPLLSALRAQAATPGARAATASGRRLRQPAITPTYPLKPSEMARTTPRAAAAARPTTTSTAATAKAAAPVTAVAAKTTVPATSPVVPRTVSAEVPSKVLGTSDTAYSMVRKHAPSTPPKKR